MKKFLIAGSSLAAVAAAGSAGAVDVTLGGSIDMGWKYGVGKGADAMNGFGIIAGKQYQAVTLNLGVAGTTSAGLKFGGNVTLSTADELAIDPYKKAKINSGKVTGYDKYMWKYLNEEGEQVVRGKAYNVSGGAAVSAGQIVSVKINSAWYDHKSSVSALAGGWGTLTDEAVCKVAGVAKAINGTPYVTRAVSGNTKVVQNINIVAGDYLPAGKVASSADVTLTARAVPTKGTPHANGNHIEFDADEVGTTQDNDRYHGDETDAKSVYAGPFMEVKMTSSSTKMVVGAVCVDKDFTQSSTKAYLNVASRIVHVSDASVFIEGGFGKLSLSTSAYTGSVAGVGGAGDQVKVGNTGVVAHLSSVSFMGLSGSAAVDLGTVNINQRPNYAFGTSVDLLGLSIAVEMEDEVQGVDKDGKATNVGYIDKWDAGTSYDLNGMSVAIATDSANDWAMSLGYELMGFSMTSVVENISKGKSKKSGLNIDTTFATSLNGVTVAVSLDEELNWGIGASYTIGNEGLSLYANYSDEDGGGKMGAKMSF